MLDTPAPILFATGTGYAVTGWRYLWLKYVSGFDGDHHCAKCLVGPFSKKVRRDMKLNTAVVLDEAPAECLYLCGVAMRGGWASNLHLAFVPEPGSSTEMPSSTGVTFVVQNARRLAIPDLPNGFDGRTAAFTTCRNWRFGVARYGLRPKLQASAVHG